MRAVEPSVGASLALGSAVLMGLLGCGEGPTDPGGELATGEFRLTVRGSFQESLQGSAYSVSADRSSSTERPVWVLDLDDGPSEFFLRLGVPFLPPAGTYEIVPPPASSDSDTLADDRAFFTFDLTTADSTRLFFRGASGRLVIEEATANEVRGRIEFETSPGSVRSTDREVGPVSGEVRFRARENARKALDSRTANDTASLLGRGPG